MKSVKEPWLSKLLVLNKKIQKKKKSRELSRTKRDLSPPDPILPKDLSTINILTIDSLEIARQLTLIEEKLFKSILIPDFVNTEMKHASSVMKMIQRFNVVSAWVSMTILNEVNLRRRVNVFEKFIDICENLRQLQNFNGVFEIVAALESSAVHRLKNTKEHLSSLKLLTFQRCNRIASSPSEHRDLLQSSTPPLIPYFGMFLSDLVQISEGNPERDEGYINFQKQTLIAKTVKTFKKIRSYTYNLQPVPELQEWLETLNPIMDEEIHYSLSTYIEPKTPTPPLEKTNDWKSVKIRLTKSKKSMTKDEINYSEKFDDHPTENFFPITESDISAQLLFYITNRKNDINKNYKQQKEEIVQMFDSVGLIIEERKQQALEDLRKQYKQSLTDLSTLQREMQQILHKAGTVLQHTPGVSNVALVEWVWNNDQGGFTPYDNYTSCLLEDEYLKCDTGTITLTHGVFGTSSGGFLIDFKTMKQKKLENGQIREIQRRPNFISKEEHKKQIQELEDKINQLQSQKLSK